ncbi:MAG: triphosphoribosyl-dephospho-CoA synthase [Synergistetes bacterium]|nr:triphosphoribosyl-dephospho-CoA synthase [Synergistota bacterium]MDW8191589.1 triphosphoribosyl-dephospho-CoA synthase [Synergistota bacterium]
MREIVTYEISEVSIRIAELALTSMLYEVASYPSPGLVSPFSSGSHKDMDFFIFLKSSSVLFFPIALCAEIGRREELEAIFGKLRKIGVEAERRMFEVTGGVNTQKGLLFLFGIISASVGYMLGKGESITPEGISMRVREICKGIVEKDLSGLHLKKSLTRGESLYIKYGIKGIRGEVEKGLPTVINYGLPALIEAKKAGLNDNDAIVHTLLAIMQVAEDTNVIGRFSLEALEEVRGKAKNVMSMGGMLTEEGRKAIFEMDEDFKRRGISPGGSADLAAATFFIYLLCTQL